MNSHIFLTTIGGFDLATMAVIAALVASIFGILAKGFEIHKPVINVFMVCGRYGKHFVTMPQLLQKMIEQSACATEQIHSEIALVRKETQFNGGSTMRDQIKETKEILLEMKARSGFRDQIDDKALFRMDAAGNVTFVNPVLCELLGYDSSELLGKDWRNVIVPHELASVLSSWKEARRALAPFERIETIIHGRTNEQFQVRVYAKPHIDKVYRNPDAPKVDFLRGFNGTIERCL